ncbi:MAG: class I SAM-dependent methyltransferase [Planctomycetota bacterium]
MSVLDPDAEFIGRVTSHLEGWLTDDDAAVTADLLRLQEGWAADAPLVEIGVYCGKYLSLLMHSAARTGSQVFGIDTFQFKELPVVTDGLAALMPEFMPRLSLHKGSSRDLNAKSLLRMIGRPARFISVDGSHDYPDVLHDLRLAGAALAPDGLVAIDDFLNPLAIGVNRAVNAFLETRPSLVGVACGPNKLFLARPSQARRYRQHLEDHLLQTSAARGQLFRSRLATWRGLVEQDFFGSPLLLYAAG